MSAEQSEQARAEMIRNLRIEQARLEKEQAELNAMILQQRLDVEAKIRRLEGDFPEGDICLDCWVNYGTIANLQPDLNQDGSIKRHGFLRCERCGAALMR